MPERVACNLCVYLAMQILLQFFATFAVGATITIRDGEPAVNLSEIDKLISVEGSALCGLTKSKYLHRPARTCRLNTDLYEVLLRKTTDGQEPGAFLRLSGFACSDRRTLKQCSRTIIIERTPKSLNPFAPFNKGTTYYDSITSTIELDRQGKVLKVNIDKTTYPE